MSEEDDRAIVARYQQGDVAAFRTLYHRHRVGTFNFTLHLVRDKAIAEDLHQEMWISVARAALTWKPEGSLKSWLFQIARNRCLDHLRKIRREPLHPDVEEDEDPVAAIADETVPAPADLGLRDVLLSCMSALGESQRQVFVLRGLEGMTFAEITEVMATAPGLANRRMQLAVGHLKRCLESKGIRAQA